MSIYGSTVNFDATDHAEDCVRWVECHCPDRLAHRTAALGVGVHWRYDETLVCTCLCGPIVYQGSHVLPSTQDRRGGSFGLAEISGFITRDGRDDGPGDEDTPWPWLRVSIRADGAVDCQDVILDRSQITELRDYLSGWLDRTGSDQ